jgi:hypothetical protein
MKLWFGWLLLESVTKGGLTEPSKIVHSSIILRKCLDKVILKEKPRRLDSEPFFAVAT